MAGQATDSCVGTRTHLTLTGRFTVCGGMGDIYFDTIGQQKLSHGGAMPRREKGENMVSRMENENGAGHNWRYLVISTESLKQRQLERVLADRFPKERGRIFIPEREYWIRKTQSIGKKPMFPGYLFALTDMSPAQLHLFIRQNSKDIQTFANELAVREMKASGAAFALETENETQSWIELSEEESEFMDRMLDEEGVERMSVGYRENNRYVVMEGPLKGWEKHIVKSERHDREAYLDLSFREKRIVVGLIQKPKKDFFPDVKTDEDTLVLEDETEVDLKELSKQMMGSAIS